MIKNQQMMLTARGRIRCARCQARSKRTGRQCGAPSMRDKAVCKIHGGLSTGARTEAGRNRIAAAQLKHGRFTKDAIQKRQEIAARIHALEGAKHLLGMTDAPRIRGRKPARYEPLMTLEDVPRALGIHGDRLEDDES